MKAPCNVVKKAMGILIGEYWQKPMTCKEYNKILHSVYCPPVWFEEYVDVRYGKFANGTAGVVIVGLQTERKY